MNTVLEINNLTKKYGRITAVNNLSLSIERGSVFGILGPNGSGKTTTLGILLDVINKTSGEFSWFGQPPTKEVRKRIGAILETPIFYPYLNAVKNLEIVAEIKGVPKSNIDISLQKVDLFERRFDNFKTYSLGMRQRLSIASALLCDPEVMILDEPTNGLDPQGIAEIRGLIQQIAKDGKTIILASHLLDEVQKVCSHFCVLKRGKLLHVGTVDEVTKGAELVEVMANNPALLEQALQQFKGVKNISKEEDKFIVTLSEGQSAADLNQFLFDQKLVATHLLTQRKSLEKQFLEVLAQSDHA
ncbi:ABC transporter ATP-binding protein [Fulvivirga sediminis]|uniref:ABC transporter ATP-binding protein n=1 Tax=Fulvivirga sediminis TaxID=2803949 RepID=A0A937F807_9BACT|nr:ABC transporter ATP-binding protein [Fulvivirga sediminis]MBL3658011.1 ABC transporter ATP-binding protein [Fulvivirga sediminis]